MGIYSNEPGDVWATGYRDVYRKPLVTMLTTITPFDMSSKLPVLSDIVKALITFESTLVPFYMH